MEATPVLKKLKLNNETENLIVNAPATYLAMLKDVRFDNTPQESKIGRYGFVQVFATNQAELEELSQSVGHAGKYDCLLWLCYPKGTGNIKSNIKRETVWQAMELIEIRPVSQIAIDDTWSALRGRPYEMVGK